MAREWNEANELIINNKYLRNGDIEPDQLFASVDVTAEVEGQMEFIAEAVPRALMVMETLEMPNPSPRNSGVVADFLKNWIPIFKSLVSLPEKSISGHPAHKPHQVGELEELDVQLIVEIPPSFNLSRIKSSLLRQFEERRLRSTKTCT